MNEKRDFLRAVLARDTARAEQLRKQIDKGDNTPWVIGYEVKVGLYYLDWEDKVLTKEQFSLLRALRPARLYLDEKPK